MGGQAAEQIIAGVVLSERLAVTMYGAIHRAQFNGARNLRGLVVDPKMLAEASFRIALNSPKANAPAIGLDHKNIVPTMSVEEGGPDVVVVTRGIGRYVTVQDLIAAARANRKEGGKLPLPVAAAIAKSVVAALSVAHRAKVVHGAVHPRSVLVDEDGEIRVGDFVVGRALTTAVAQGADSSLWRGLAGYLAPELVVGEDPTPAADVFACGAMLFTMLSGEVPPGTLHVTPAVERLVQRALDTDLVRRYKNAIDLFENMLEAFEDDRWDIADRGEIIRAAGLSQSDSNIDEATEDLLASLGNSAVQVTPMRPSIDQRASEVAARHTHTKTPTGSRLDALLHDLDDVKGEHTIVEDNAFKRDPISEIIHADPRRKEAIVQVKARVPSLDDPDDTPLPLPQRDSDGEVPRPNTRDEDLAMSAIDALDQPVQRMKSAAEIAEEAAQKLADAAVRAEAAAKRVETHNDVVATPKPPPRPVAQPILEHPDFDVPAPRIKSRTGQIVGVLALAAMVGIGVFIYKQKAAADDENERIKKENEERDRLAREETERRRRAQADAGAIEISSSPGQAGVWLRLGRTTVDSLRLQTSSTHELGLLLDGYQYGEIHVVAGNWQGPQDNQIANVKVELKPLVPDKKTKKLVPAELPVQPNATHDPTTLKGSGKIHVESTPSDAETYLFVGITGSMKFNELVAGRDYEFVVTKPGFKPKHVSIKADDWRDNDPNTPIDEAKKKSVLQRDVELEAVAGKEPGKDK